VPGDAVRAPEDELRRAPADVDDECGGVQVATGRDATKGQEGLLVSGDEARVEAVAPLHLAEERLSVFRVANRARRHGERSLGPPRLQLPAILGENVAHAGDRGGKEEAALVDALAEARDGQPALDLVDDAVLDVRNEQASRVRAEVDDPDACHFFR
jgi:hypothetical protein